MSRRCPCCSRRAIALLTVVLTLVTTIVLLLPKRPLLLNTFRLPITTQAIRNASLEHLDILMLGMLPLLTASSPDAYQCTALQLSKHSTLYIVGFEPRGVYSHQEGSHLYHQSSSPTHMVHHMLLAACDRIPTDKHQWNCGSMNMAASLAESKSTDEPMVMCSSGLRYLYAYAMEATPLRLPEEVAFPVGGAFGGGYLVLQVHYTINLSLKAQSQGPNRHPAGIRLSLLPAQVAAQHPPSRLAGVHLSATGGLIPPRSVAHLSVGCPYMGNMELHPFAFRVHTHRLGRVVSVYRLQCRNGFGNRREKWSLIGRANPQMMQAFYPVNGSGLRLVNGDCVAAVCVMENTSEKLVRIGPTAGDEMCNAYVMYWYQNENGSSWDGHDNGCISKGFSDLWVEAPSWVLNLSSRVPGTERYLPPVEGIN